MSAHLVRASGLERVIMLLVRLVGLLRVCCGGCWVLGLGGEA